SGTSAGAVSVPAAEFSRGPLPPAPPLLKRARTSTSLHSTCGGRSRSSEGRGAGKVLCVAPVARQTIVPTVSAPHSQPAFGQARQTTGAADPYFSGPPPPGGAGAPPPRGRGRGARARPLQQGGGGGEGTA